MAVSDTLSRLCIDAEEDVHNMITLNILQHLNTPYIYSNYKHLQYDLYKYKVNIQIQVITKTKG